MQDFENKVAVVTGGASGIGFALAERCAAEGMRVVLADIEQPRLADAEATLSSRGTEVLAVPTDVSQADSVAELAHLTLERFGGVHLVFNNAGVIAGGTTWESPLSDYEWLMGVNMWGVIHGIRTFVPLLLEQDTATHIVNTSSMAGVTSMPYAGIYHMTKHGVLALSESLFHELNAKQAKVGVSVLCPEGVATGIHQSGRNRPESLAPSEPSAESRLIDASLAHTVATGVDPELLASRTFDAICAEQFYILAPGIWRTTCNQRLDDVREARNPILRVPIEP
jgi:NAD(P)-dependent dehydrogenase (short-subunit alcohol dehydrogenase family)